MKKLSIFLILFPGCIKEYKGITATYINNTTGHVVEIIPYYKGNIDSISYRRINPNERLKASEVSVPGKGIFADYPTGLQPNDSVVILYDDSVRSTHLKFSSALICEECVEFSSDRSIRNPENYKKTITKENKHIVNGYFTYTFTEEDYLSAKNK